jgi:ATP-dependent RNA helicase DDX19/DBP5
VLKKNRILLNTFFYAKDVSLFILDEADVLMDHSSNMASQINEIRKAFQQKTQVLLFSATYPERVKQFVTVHVPSASRIEVKAQET